METEKKAENKINDSNSEINSISSKKEETPNANLLTPDRLASKNTHQSNLPFKSGTVKDFSNRDILNEIDSIIHELDFLTSEITKIKKPDQKNYTRDDSSSSDEETFYVEPKVIESNFGMEDEELDLKIGSVSISDTPDLSVVQIEKENKSIKSQIFNENFKKEKRNNNSVSETKQIEVSVNPDPKIDEDDSLSIDSVGAALMEAMEIDKKNTSKQKQGKKSLLSPNKNDKQNKTKTKPVYSSLNRNNFENIDENKSKMKCAESRSLNTIGHEVSIQQETELLKDTKKSGWFKNLKKSSKNKSFENTINNKSPNGRKSERNDINIEILKSSSAVSQKTFERAFKLCSLFSKHKKFKKQEKEEIIIKISHLAWIDLSFKDDIYRAMVQLIAKSTSVDSQNKLSELMCICLQLCPPSRVLIDILENYFTRRINNDETPVQNFMMIISNLNSLKNKSSNKGLLNPTCQDVIRITQSLYNFTMFGIDLDDLMSHQNDRFPDLPIPWLLVMISNMVVKTGGYECEGIFRIPGDSDKVQKMRLSVSLFQKLPDNYTSNDFASLLKGWCRDLPTPLIPNSFYDTCIKNSTDFNVIMDVMKNIPSINYLCILFIVKFLRPFLREEYVEKTKMNIQNISMVWAPSFLRSPFSDPKDVATVVALENAFTRTLIEKLDTSHVDDIPCDGNCSEYLSKIQKY